MEKITLEKPFKKVIQEEKTETTDTVLIYSFEDNGSEIKVRTNIGLYTVYGGEDYPEGGIFTIRKADLITEFKTILNNIKTIK